MDTLLPFAYPTNIDVFLKIWKHSVNRIFIEENRVNHTNQHLGH